MKIVLGALVNSKTQLEALVPHKYPAEFTWRLLKIVSIVNREVALFEEARNKMIVAMGEEKDGVTTVKPEQVPEFQKQINELMMTEMELDIPELSITDLAKLELSIEELFPIAYLMKEREDLENIFNVRSQAAAA